MLYSNRTIYLLIIEHLTNFRRPAFADSEVRVVRPGFDISF